MSKCDRSSAENQNDLWMFLLFRNTNEAKIEANRVTAFVPIPVNVSEWKL